MSARLGDLSFFLPPLATFLAVDDAFSATFLEVVLALVADLVTDSLAFDAAFFEEALVTVAICLAFLVAAYKEMGWSTESDVSKGTLPFSP